MTECLLDDIYGMETISRTLSGTGYRIRDVESGELWGFAINLVPILSRFDNRKNVGFQSAWILA